MFLATLSGFEEMYPLGVFDDEAAARSAAAAAWWRRRRYWRLAQAALDAEMGEISSYTSDHVRPKVIALPYNSTAQQWWERRLESGDV